MENQTQEKDQKISRFYNWSIVTYMDEENLKRCLTEQCRNWAYALHDKDKGKEPHRHVVCTFDQNKSFSTVKRLFSSYAEGQNSLFEPCKDLGGALEYLTHSGDSKDQKNKYQYDERIVNYSQKSWYSKYIKGEEENDNDHFVEDLLVPKNKFSVIDMARRYGRDFMKNMKSYLEFRRVALAERAGFSALEAFYGYSADERDMINKNNEDVNSILKES